jgi:hypothetical protein
VANDEFYPSAISGIAGFHARKANLAWESRVSSATTLEEELTWLLHMPQYQKWYYDPGLDKFPRLLRVQYDCTNDWEANVARVFEQNLREREEQREEKSRAEAHIVTFLGPAIPSQCSEDLTITLPQSLIGQIFTKFPECIHKAAEIHQQIRHGFFEANWNTDDLDKAAQHCWGTLLASKASNWRALWTCLSSQ